VVFFLLAAIGFVAMMVLVGGGVWMFLVVIAAIGLIWLIVYTNKRAEYADALKKEKERQAAEDERYRQSLAADEEQRREKQREFIRDHWLPGINPARWAHCEDYVQEEYEKLDTAFAALSPEQQEKKVRQLAEKAWHQAKVCSRFTKTRPHITPGWYTYAPLRREIEKLDAAYDRRCAIEAEVLASMRRSTSN
jgi:hypothetical protein